MASKVTAVVPYYNMSRFVAETINSLLAQTWPDLDIVIVDDGSTEEESRALRQFAENPRISIITKVNEGVSIARNTGIAAASGEYILALDADDLLKPSFAEKAVAVLDSDENVGLVEACGHYFGTRRGLMRRKELSMENILSGRCHCGYGMFRKTDWAAAGGYSPDLVTYEDLDFWLSIIELGKRIHRIDEVLYSYRRHDQSAMVRHRRADPANFRPTGLLRAKHKALFDKYPEILEKNQGLPSLDAPKFMEFKAAKYKIIIGLAKLPVLSGLLGKQARRAAGKLEFIKAIKKAQLEINL